jgi:hypothetical protein
MPEKLKQQHNLKKTHKELKCIRRSSSTSKVANTNAYKGGIQLEHRISWLDLLLDISDKWEDNT